MAQDPEGESDQLDITEEQLVSRLYDEAELFSGTQSALYQEALSLVPFLISV